MRLIGIASMATEGGTGRVGKDTAARLLAEDGYVRLAFADPLYAAVQVLLGLTDAEMAEYVRHKDLTIPRWGQSLREVLQGLGDWAQRTFGERVFVETLSTALDRDQAGRYQPGEVVWSPLDAARMPPAGYVVPDVRLEHEAAWIRDKGGLVIHLQGPRRSDAEQSGMDHKTEAGVQFVPGRDVMVVNDGTEHELHLKLRGVIMAAGEAA